ncbi:MAG: hypothetical protein PGN23_08345 [Sphingomonas adhaesiva]|uniref:hypothetical protein n=1 Tax=Sphingomonas adhaesiva TaxID=28212 RepID=UPI002FF6FC84
MSVTLSSLPPLLLALAAPLAVSGGAPERAPPPPAVRWTQMTIHERLIIRIPRMPRGAVAPARGFTPVIWQERKAPRCVTMTDITGAMLDREGEVDLVVEGVKRVRAKLNADCPTLDFYSGLYLKPTGDGKMCARRDSIRTRSGARCAITAFRTLVPKR